MSAASASGRREGCAQVPGGALLGVGASAVLPVEWKGGAVPRGSSSRERVIVKNFVCCLGSVSVP